MIKRILISLAVIAYVVGVTVAIGNGSADASENTVNKLFYFVTGFIASCSSLLVLQALEIHKHIALWWKWVKGE